jgi:hypothetical protein
MASRGLGFRRLNIRNGVAAFSLVEVMVAMGLIVITIVAGRAGPARFQSPGGFQSRDDGGASHRPTEHRYRTDCTALIPPLCPPFSDFLPEQIMTTMEVATEASASLRKRMRQGNLVPLIKGTLSAKRLRL